MSGALVVAVLGAGSAAACLLSSSGRALQRLRPAGPRVRGARAAAAGTASGQLLGTGRPPAVHGGSAGPDRGPTVRRRIALATLVASVGLVLGSVAFALGLVVVAAVADRVLARLEPAAARNRTDQIVAGLPAFADLVGAAVRAGVAPQVALRTCASVVGGPIGAEVERVVAELDLGVPPEQAWSAASAVNGLTPLARAMVRGGARGTSPVTVLERCSVDARRIAQAAARRRAQAVGVAAAAPLGLCFLPAFVLVSVVPMVVGGLSAFVR